MASVTARISQIKQPYGGYLPPGNLKVVRFSDEKPLNETENVHGSIVGMVVDYMTRLMLGAKPEDAFGISLRGADAAVHFGMADSQRVAQKLLTEIKGIDKKSIISACKLVTFDVWFRNPMGAMLAKSHEETCPDEATIENIEILIKRSLAFFKKYGPITENGFTFEPANGKNADYEKMIKTRKGSFGGYTPTVDSGDGDFLTKDTLWDFKVSKSKPTNKHTLQLLMYWIMGQHSGREIFKNIKNIGIFNPRLNCVFLYDLSLVSKDIVSDIERNVICY